jgi:hypothetical protein
MMTPMERANFVARMIHGETRSVFNSAAEGSDPR